MADYQYTPLQPGEIRLAKLLPGKFDDAIVVELRHEPLIKYGSPKYEALSYAWGSRKNPQYIQIRDSKRKFNKMVKKMGSLGIHNGGQATDKLPITQNLEAALRNLRKTNAHRHLWIDAICIDQTNVVERSMEVFRMGNIYNSAERVLVWLGPSTDGTQAAVELFHQIVSKVTWNSYERRPKPINDGALELIKQFEESYGSSRSDSERAGIRDLINRPWFSRLWVWQEICRARTAYVVCGSHEMTWETLSTGLFCIDQQLRRTIAEHPDQRRNYAPIKEQTARVLKLVREADRMKADGYLAPFNLLEKTQYAKCEDPRDRIYAQISLLHSDYQKMVPDYTKSMSQVYTSAFLLFLAESGALHFLEQCGERPPDISLPSWVPHWGAPRETSPLGFRYFQAGSTFAEADCEDETILNVRGVSSARITEVSERVSLTPSFGEVVSVWRAWAQPKSHEHKYSTGESLHDAYCFTLVSGELIDRYPEETYSPSLNIARISLGHPEDEDTEERRKQRQSLYLEPGKDRSATSILFSEYENDVVNICAGRRLFATAEGYIGVGPANLQTDDAICVLLGLKYPIILRPAGNEQYQVIGCCYVHGLMDGEALLGPIPDNLHVEYRTPKAVDGQVGIDKPFFVNTKAWTMTDRDPRLWNLPPRWSWYYNEFDELRFRKYHEKSTSKDPRFSSEELEKHGVKIQVFPLV